MNRELWLLRHGKAERYDGMEDFDRALKKRGKRDAKLIGAWLEGHGLKPDLVISSPATRAHATAKIVCNTLKIDHHTIRTETRLYDEGLARIISVLAGIAPAFEKVLLVGHNPELEDLLCFLVKETDLPEVDKLFPTATLARLALPDDWTQLTKGCAALLSISYPKLLIQENREEFN